MKKLTIGLAVLLSGIAATAQAAYPTGTSPCSVSVPSYSGGFTFGLTGLYWRATSPQRNVAVSFIPDDLFDAESFFEDDFSFADFGDHHYHNINHEFEWGFKANVGYIFPCTGNDVNLTYTHYNDDHDKTINDFVLPSLLPVIALLNDPFAGPQVTTDAGTDGTITFAFELNDLISTFVLDDVADFSHQFYAKSELKNHTWDLDFGQAINVGCNFNFRLFGGLRYSKVEHKLHTINNVSVTLENPDLGGLQGPIAPIGVISSTVDGIQAGDVIDEQDTNILLEQSESNFRLALDFTESVLRKSRFEGLGPRIGVDMNYRFCGGFGLVGSMSTSLLVGRTRNDLGQSVTLTSDFNADEVVVFELDGVDLSDSDSTLSPGSATLDFSHSRPQETRVVPNIDAKLGVDYSYDFCNCSHTRLTVEAGYQVSHYFSAIDRLGWTDGLNLGLDNGCHNTVDVSFDGPYVSVQVAL